MLAGSSLFSERGRDGSRKVARLFIFLFSPYSCVNNPTREKKRERERQREKSKEEKTKKDKNPEAKFRSRAREKKRRVTVFLEGVSS